MRIASIFFLISLPSLCKAHKQWDHSSLWLKEGEIIDVEIPAGSRQVRALLKQDESQEWKVWQTSHIPDDANGSIFFRVPHDMQKNKVRFEWNGYDPLPYSFYTGKSNFSHRASGIEKKNNLLYNYEVAAFRTTEDSVTEDESNEVEESDIWKIVGNYLFFFNQRRGLQIIDLSNPIEPKVRARYRLPASGEQMYVSDDGEYIFLFVTPPHRKWPYQSNLRVLQFKDEEIKEIYDLKLPGFYRESRMVGETLHIVTEEWKGEETEWKGWNFNYSTVLSSFDLDNPEDIKKTSEITTAGAPQVIFATNEKLAVVTRDPQDYYNGHLVRIYDLSDISKIPREISLIQPGGRILDKFKIRISGDTLTLISQANRNGNWNSRYSLLENFNIKTGELRGSLELAERETLYATRFEGDFAYIVTFLRVDPLFIVDLRAPSNPTLLSELIVPGWSEYLEVLDNQLFAVGVENRKVTASLFDVSDKANPFLSQRIFMGNENEYTWSEANYDEKALGKVPSLGLFFIPYQTWSNGKQENKLQILKYSDQLLEKGGDISHTMQIRRSVTDSTGIYLFSISGEELVVSNILDTNNPYEVTRVPLSWSTNKLHIIDEYTVQIESRRPNYWGYMGYSDQNVTLRLTPTDDFDKLIHSYNAGQGRLLGSQIENDLIHLAIQKDGNISVQVLEVDDEKIILLAKTESRLQNTSNNFEMEAFLVEENSICWATKANIHSDLMPVARRSALLIDNWYPYPYKSTTVVDVQVFEYEKNLVNSSINLESNTSFRMKASETSGPFLIGDKLIFGATHNIDHYNDYNVVASETNSSIYQVDLSNPEYPTLGQTIHSPGLLIGTQHNESTPDIGYLYFENQEVQIGNYRPTPLLLESSVNPQDFGRSMTVCAYDGANIYLLTELDLSNTSGPIKISQQASFVAHSLRDSRGIDAYKIQEDGSLLLIDSFFQSYNINQLISQEGILIGKSDDGIHISENLLEWPKQELSGNFYFDLQELSKGEFGLGIPTGNYGVEWFKRPDSISQSSSENPYNFIPPAEGDFVTMALVPYYNPRTGYTWTAPTGGWKPPEGWIAGTKEDYEASMNLRRLKSTNDWHELATEYIQVFEADKAPIFFDANATKAWKYRPNTAIDLQVEELEGQWKNQPWFGNFYDLTYPWIFHADLQWLYLRESSDGSFWLWSKEFGWLWTKSTAFPYCFSNSNEGWLYLNLKDRNSLSYYNFKSEDWIKFD